MNCPRERLEKFAIFLIFFSTFVMNAPFYVDIGVRAFLKEGRHFFLTFLDENNRIGFHDE